MGITLVQGTEASEIELDGAIDIGCAAELKALLTQTLASMRIVRVVLLRATEFDVTAAQLMHAASQEAKRLGVGFTISGPFAEATAAALEVYGIELQIAEVEALTAREEEACQG